MPTQGYVHEDDEKAVFRTPSLLLASGGVAVRLARNNASPANSTIITGAPQRGILCILAYGRGQDAQHHRRSLTDRAGDPTAKPCSIEQRLMMEARLKVAISVDEKGREGTFDVDSCSNRHGACRNGIEQPRERQQGKPCRFMRKAPERICSSDCRTYRTHNDARVIHVSVV